MAFLLRSIHMRRSTAPQLRFAAIFRRSHLRYCRVDRTPKRWGPSRAQYDFQRKTFLNRGNSSRGGRFSILTLGPIALAKKRATTRYRQWPLVAAAARGVAREAAALAQHVEWFSSSHERKWPATGGIVTG